KTIMPFVHLKSASVVVKFQTNVLGIKVQSRFKSGRVSVFESIRQGFLSNVEQIFLSHQRKFAHRAPNSELGPKRGPSSGTFDEALQCLPKRALFQSLRPQCAY